MLWERSKCSPYSFEFSPFIFYVSFRNVAIKTIETHQINEALPSYYYGQIMEEANLKSSTWTSTLTHDWNARSVLFFPRAICGHNMANADESDVWDFFIRCWSTLLAFKSILVSTTYGKHLLTEETNSSAVEGRGPTNLLYICAISVWQQEDVLAMYKIKFNCLWN